MKRAIELGWQGLGRNSPNPLVGCVIVKDGKVVGEGTHIFDLVDHAEIVALRKAGEKAEGSTVYVSVEPCCHTGRTPPCCDALIEAGVARVIYGMKDPNPLVNGEGHRLLEKAGITVQEGLLADAAREQNKFFVSVHEKGRPYVLLKWAMSSDGKIATRGGESRGIAGPQSLNVVHHLRNIYDAILVGHGTVLVDNPELTCRVDLSRSLPDEVFPAAPQDIRHPVRVVLDTFGATCSHEIRVFEQPGKTIVAVGPESEWDDSRARDSIDTERIELMECPLSGGRIDLPFLLEGLKDRGINSLLVEGGGSVHAAFLETGLADEIMVFVAPKIIGGEGAPSPVAGGGVETIAETWHLENVRHLSLDDDVLLWGRIAGEGT
jgi:diaminohydroxyphosphoribosylaminopyrimidine deaminase/5-amino-6-(5-phosphoribosylamino)uracil reductase